MKYLLIIGVALQIVSCNNNEPEIREATISIYLQDDARADTIKDRMYLERFPHVRKVDYISKEAAKKKYLEEGTQDWSHVLDVNPLPASYEVTIDANKYSVEDLETMEKQIRERIPYCKEIDYPHSVFDKR